MSCAIPAATFIIMVVVTLLLVPVIIKIISKWWALVDRIWP